MFSETPSTYKTRELASECRNARGERAGLGSVSTHSSVRLGEHRAGLLIYSQCTPGTHPPAVCTSSLCCPASSPGVSSPYFSPLDFIFGVGCLQTRIPSAGLHPRAFVWASPCTKNIFPAALGLRSRPLPTPGEPHGKMLKACRLAPGSTAPDDTGGQHALRGQDSWK